MAKLRIFHQLQAAHSALFRAADHHLRDQIGLGSAQQAILFVLAKEDGVSLGDLAKRLHLGKSGLSGLVDRMETAGLVKRIPNPHDRRVIELHIEPAGRTIAERTAPLTKAVNEELLTPFSQSEREIIARFLDHITANSEAVTASNMAAQLTEGTPA